MRVLNQPLRRLLRQPLRRLLRHLVRVAVLLLLVAVLAQPSKPSWTNFVNDLGSKP
jgi:hypothetical protein